jgi:L-lactate permease
MPFVDLIFAALPILLLIFLMKLLLIFLMKKKSPMPSARALPLAAEVAYGIRLMWFGTDNCVVHAAVNVGLLTIAMRPRNPQTVKLLIGLLVPTR